MNTPRRRHCLIRPPDDMFFSASISLKLRELANTKTSTMAIRRDRNVTAVSEDMPCVASMFSNSVLGREENHKDTHLLVIHRSAGFSLTDLLEGRFSCYSLDQCVTGTV